MDRFLSVESFSDRPAAAFSGSYAGQAVFHGCIAFCNWPRADAARVLPPELELAENRSANPDLHPVAFVAGEQREGATIFGGITFALGVHYHEVALAIPCVKHRRGRDLHIFVPRMYSSYYPATWAGNAHYGLAKEMAAITVRRGRVTVTGTDGVRRIEASCEPAGDWRAGAACELPNFAAMRTMFALPVLGRRADGSYMTSYFGWDFGPARVRRACVGLSIEHALGPGLEPRQCAALASGSFEVEQMVWRLSWPAPSEC